MKSSIFSKNLLEEKTNREIIKKLSISFYTKGISK